MECVAYHNKLPPRWCTRQEREALFKTGDWYDSPVKAKEQRREAPKVVENTDYVDPAIIMKEMLAKKKKKKR